MYGEMNEFHTIVKISQNVEMCREINGFHITVENAFFPLFKPLLCKQAVSRNHFSPPGDS